MTTNMRNAIEQAAYEVGLATAKYDLLISHSQGTMTLGQAGVAVNIGPLTSGAKSLSKPGKIAVSPKPTKVSRGVRKSTGPRTPGVKKGILNLISSNAMSVADIITKTGFNDNSVRATLMSLKKAGLAENDAGLWMHAGHVSGNGNSEDANEDVRF